MKYLKRFNESLESYYEEILGDDVILNHETNDEVEFTNHEVEIIKSLLKDYRVCLKGWKDGIVFFDGSIIFEISLEVKIGDKINVYYIYKYDDEWYILLEKEINIYGRDEIKYYKCDQFEGLLKCLKDKTSVK